jgi:hypothetical protein
LEALTLPDSCCDYTTTYNRTWQSDASGAEMAESRQEALAESTNGQLPLFN